MIATKPKNEANKELSLGFLGVGWIGRNRMEAILGHTGSKAIAIVEPQQENAGEAKKLAPKTSHLDSLEEMLKEEELDGVVIATPSAMHASQSIKALQAGKAVFCQKPLGRTAIEVREVVETARHANKLLGVDLSYRYTRAFKAIYELIKNGNIGDIYAIDLVFHNAYGPDKDWFYDIRQSGGGCVMDLGIHLVDLALWALDFPEVKEVRSRLYHQGKRLDFFEEQVEDFASVNMYTTNETNINLECSWHVSAGRDAVIEARFYGTKGGAAFKNINGSFYNFTAEKYNGTQTEVLVSPPDDWSGRAGVVWAQELLNGKEHDPKAGEEFIRTAEIIDRIYGR